MTVTLRNQLFKLFSTNHSARERRQLPVRAALLLALHRRPSLSYRDVFRVLIVQFMDAQSLDIPRSEELRPHGPGRWPDDPVRGP